MDEVSSVLKDHIIGMAHVGFIVESLQSAIVDMKRVYGVSDSDIRIVPPLDQPTDTRFAFVSIWGSELELIEPVSDHFKQVLLSMPSGSGGINHIAYCVDDVNAVLKLMESAGIRPGHVTPDGIVDVGDKKILYLDPADTGGLVIELIEVKH